MKTKSRKWLITLALLALTALNAQLSTARAQGTAFTYQGQLQNNGSPANGSYDLTFTLYNASSGGIGLFGPLTNSAITITNGLFTTSLDFGSNAFGGASLWLQIGVRTNDGASFTPLTPRQQVTPTPYAIYSENSGAANSVIASSVSAGSLFTPGAPASGEVLTYNGSSLAWSNPAAGGGSGWSLTGNSGTIPGTNFLGTSDNEPLELWANGGRAFRLEPGGGYPNVIGGTSQNVVASGFGGAFIGGGYGNSVNQYWGVVAGGEENTASYADAVGGGEVNTASGNGDTIGGGEDNVANGSFSTVSGGLDNTASGNYSFAAGYYAQATNSGAFVWADAEGLPFSSTTTNQFNVRANGGVRFVTGGAGMTIDGVAVGSGGGGGGSNANYTISTVQTTNSGLDSSAMGYQNTASGNYATVPGGSGNVASGQWSFAAGENATAGDNNSFLWCDGTRNGVSQGANTFTVLATGGTYFYTTTGNLNVEVDPTGDVDFGTTTRQMLNLWSTLYGIGVQSSTLYQRTAAGGGFAWFAGGVHTNAQDNPGGGTTVMTLDGSGDLNVTANASVCSLSIRGGCDLAEPFQFSSADNEIPQGAVVVIDEENPGHLKLSDQPYDARVAGVVSGANGIHPGIQMQQEGLLEGGKNVALTGRVYVQADTSNGVIKPGDLLTTSTTPGRAMRVSDHLRAQGAILGKAMTGLKDGQGMVLVLVTLQ